MANEGIITHIFAATKMLQNVALSGSVDVKKGHFIVKKCRHWR